MCTPYSTLHHSNPLPRPTDAIIACSFTDAMAHAQ